METDSRMGLGSFLVRVVILPQKHTLTLGFKQNVGGGDLCCPAVSECDS